MDNSNEQNVLLSVNNITKSFPGVKALSEVSFDLLAGEVHALVGENGAGKSTLIKTISGVHSPDSGSIKISGKEIKKFDPHYSRTQGVATVFQELSLVAELTVEENMTLGCEPLKFPFLRQIDHAQRTKKANQFLEYIGAKIDPKKKIEELGAAQQQLVEIAKALLQDAKILILDEPTDKLFGKEQEILFDLVRQLKKEGKGIIYITHKLEELDLITDRITVLRDGKVVSTSNTKEVNQEQIIKMMVGRELKDLFPKVRTEPGKEILKLERVTVRNILKDISFSLREGEVVGIMGLVGAGRTELAKTICGILPLSTGQIYCHGKKININNPQKAVENGIALVPEERHSQGLVLKLPVRENVNLASVKNWVLNSKKLKEKTNKYVDLLNIRTPTIDFKVNNLSGGNQQKVVIAKWLCANSKILIFDEPTQGIDVGAKTEIYKIINDLASKGACILLISSDMREILGMSDRILVMNQGRVANEYSSSEATQEKLLRDAIKKY